MCRESLKETLRIFDVYILPEWKDRKADDLQRSDVADLLDKIAAGKLEHKSATKTGKTKKMLIGTPGVAVTVYTQLVSLFGWYGARSDTFKTPIVKTVIGNTWNSRCRDRKLCPEEIRALSQATEDMLVYGACIRTALLTAQRFFKVAYMRRSDIRNGVWAARRKDDPKKKQVSEEVSALDGGVCMDRDGKMGVHLDVPINGFAGRLEMIEGPTGRRQRSEAAKARIAAESLMPGVRVADIARKYGATRWRLDLIPAQLRVLVTRRPKYACRRCSAAVAQAHAPEHVVPSGLPTEALIAQVIVTKFGDHLPFL
jgi:hypothetical protein